MGDSWGSKAVSGGYKGSSTGGAKRVSAQGPGGGKTGIKAGSRMNPEVGTTPPANSGKIGGAMKTWTSNSKSIKG